MGFTQKTLHSLYSNPNAKEEEIIEAAKKAGAYDFISNLKRGFDTMIGEMGKKLSGGEKQKISIARALIKNSDIIIMDEIMTHLDRQSEEKLYNTFTERYSDKTGIFIAHKLSPLLKVDRLFILERGGIAWE